jgi:hypothetical protein
MTATDDHPASAPRLSLVSIRRPSVMLVRIEPGEEPTGLDLDGLALRIFRVRHPLPACVRMGVLLPEAVLVGPSVQSRDLAPIIDVARQIQAAVIWMPHHFFAGSLRDRLLDQIDLVRQRRGERAKLARAG